MKQNKVYLIGYMGSGKTTIGKRLAKAMGLHFLDLDLFIENRHRKSIQQIFTEKGEDYFRKIEHQALREVAEFENIVISTGGGLPCFYDNLQLMKKTGTSIYLKVPVEQLVKRLEKAKESRPLLKDKNSEEIKTFVTNSLEKRETFYNQATLVFDAKNFLSYKDVDVIVSKLISYLSQNENDSSREGSSVPHTSGID